MKTKRGLKSPANFYRLFFTRPHPNTLAGIGRGGQHQAENIVHGSQVHDIAAGGAGGDAIRGDEGIDVGLVGHDHDLRFRSIRRRARSWSSISAKSRTVVTVPQSHIR